MFAERRGDNALEIFAITMSVWGEGIASLFWPTKLSILYPEPSGPGMILMLGLMTLITAIWSWFNRAKNPMLAIGLCWFVLALIPFSQLTPLQNLRADRYLLVPGAGAVIACCWISSKQPKLIWVALPWMLFCGALTMKQISVFRSSETLWHQATERAPEAPRNWSSLVGLLLEEQRKAEAEAVLIRALTHHPNHPRILQSQGLLFLAQGRSEQAISSLRKAWEQRSSLRISGNNLALLLLKQGLNEEALSVARSLTSLHPHYVLGWNTLSSIEIASNNAAEAILAAQKSTKLAPHDPKGWVNLGSSFFLAKRYQLAKQAWKQALALDATLEYPQQGLREIERQTATEVSP